MCMYTYKLQEMVKDRDTWRAAVHAVIESDTTERLNNSSFIIVVNSVLIKLSYCTPLLI